jgi:23S rRNA pseudouridine2605 synthase
LQKVLASAGVASRRKCEELIQEGRVTVDGVTVQELGTKVDPDKQRIAVDGKIVEQAAKTVILMHKPTACITSVTDPEGRKTVMDFLPEKFARVFPVGRLDYDTSGLLLLTNDGELAHRLMHPSHELDKVYRATVIGMPEKDTLKQLQAGIELEDGMTSPARVQVLRHHPQESVLEITIHEGRNRQIRRMMEAVGFPVKRLKRIQLGPLTLKRVGPGHWRELDAEERYQLYASVGLTPARPKSGRPARKPGQAQRRKSKRV